MMIKKILHKNNKDQTSKQSNLPYICARHIQRKSEKKKKKGSKLKSN